MWAHGELREYSLRDAKLKTRGNQTGSSMTSIGTANTISNLKQHARYLCHDCIGGEPCLPRAMHMSCKATQSAFLAWRARHANASVSGCMACMMCMPCKACTVGMHAMACTPCMAWAVLAHRAFVWRPTPRMVATQRGHIASFKNWPPRIHAKSTWQLCKSNAAQIKPLMLKVIAPTGT